jgi:hypothetical protein
LLDFPYLVSTIGYLDESVVAVGIGDGSQFALIVDSIWWVAVEEDLPIWQPDFPGILDLVLVEVIEFLTADGVRLKEVAEVVVWGVEAAGELDKKPDPRFVRILQARLLSQSVDRSRRW